MQPGAISDQCREDGYALVLTLLVILALALMTEAMTRWVSSAVDHALAHREEAEAKRQMAENNAIAMYLLATRPLSMRGLELLLVEQLRSRAGTSVLEPAQPAESFLRLDDHPYRLGDAVVRLQDARGLINLNLGSDYDLYALLGLFGVEAAARGPLIAKLQDYTDADSLVRLNGAEAPGYEEAGREPPANGPLRTPWEVRRILDWDRVDGIMREDTSWPLLTATAPLAGFNINTAPPALLALIPWMTPDAVVKILRWRVEQPILGNFQLRLLTGIPVAEDPLRDRAFPANSLILTLSAKHWPLERRIAVRLTPKSRDHPWIIDYDVELPRTARDMTSEPAGDDLPLSRLLSPNP
jgi:general secretion pathway protein K